MQRPNELARLLTAYFDEWLGASLNVSGATVRAYSDAVGQFLDFASATRAKEIDLLSLRDFDVDLVSGFLKHLEEHRGVSVATRNLRLAALRGFFGYVLRREPAHAALCAAVRALPRKRGVRREPTYFETDELRALLKTPDRRTPTGLRDYVLMVLLCETGARVQEVLNLRPMDVRFEAPGHVRLVCKGRKERLAPIDGRGVGLLQELLAVSPRRADEPIFSNRYGTPMGASGVRYRLARYVAAASVEAPTLKAKRVSPHTFRHTVAIELEARRVNEFTIQGILGHASIETTGLYARANLRAKREALEPLPGLFGVKGGSRWRPRPGLRDWLRSLTRSAQRQPR